MYDYEVSFYLDGIKYIETVKATSASNAEKLIKARYQGQKITCMYSKRI